MTRLVRKQGKKKQRTRPKGRPWALQDAKASFSEVVRRAQESGPQHVTVHGKESVVVVSAEEFAKLTIHAKYPTLRALLAPMRDAGLEFERQSIFPPVRPPIEL